jgi:hypothetical protein
MNFEDRFSPSSSHRFDAILLELVWMEAAIEKSSKSNLTIGHLISNSSSITLINEKLIIAGWLN